ncbi:MAG: hypothetical protein VB122_08875 [Erysipelotrichales bacterium]|nr:hypothetical protein [Erysipelotrichales bacterium]
MSKWTKFAIIFLLITNLVFIFTTVKYRNINNCSVFKAYSYKGQNDAIKINNGVIILSKDKHVIQGGELQYMGERLENIKSYTKTIYINNHGNKETLLESSVVTSGFNGIIFPDDLLLNENLGNIEGGKLFLTDGFENLYFSLEGITNEGKEFNYELKLEVKELI